jgi:hypothetical protein
MQKELAKWLHKNQIEGAVYRQIIIGFLRETLKANKSLLVAYFLIAAFCSLIFLASLQVRELINILSSSASTPWGILTAVFVHGGGFTHYANNMFGLLLYFFLFSLTNLNSRGTEKKVSIRYFMVLIFSVGFFSNLLWIIFKPLSVSSGLSGVVYASEGVLLACSFSNTLTLFRLGKSNTEEKKRVYLQWILNFLVFLCIFGSLTSNPAIFLNAAPRVNVFAHAISFVSAFFFEMGRSSLLKVFKPKKQLTNFIVTI